MRKTNKLSDQLTVTNIFGNPSEFGSDLGLRGIGELRITMLSKMTNH